MLRRIFGQPKQGGSLTQCIIGEAVVHAIVSKNSAEVDTLVEEYLESRVQVFGEPKGYAMRTEIHLPDALVVVHRNPAQMEGIFATAVHPSKIEVIKGDERFALEVEIDPGTSPFNPIYLFVDESGSIVGDGRGSRIDLKIASRLLRELSLTSYDYTSWYLINWLREKITN